MKTFSSFIAISLFAGSVGAADFSFTGNFTRNNQVQEFNFTVASTSDVTLRTWSYAGGINAEGEIIARGGFDPIVSLFNAATGDLIKYNDDEHQIVDPVSGSAYDSFLTQSLAGGNYIATVTQFTSFPNSSLADGFLGSSQGGVNPRDLHWALDILNTESASLGRSYTSSVVVVVPEPETYALLLAGLSLIGLLRVRETLANRLLGRVS
jgi:hypothetical protein